MDLKTSLNGVLVGIVVIAAILTAPFALLLISLYRRAVIRLMSKRAQSVPAGSATPLESRLPPAALTTKPEFVSLDKISLDKNEATMDMYSNLRRRPWQAVAVYVLGGLVFTTVLTIAFLLESNFEVSALRLLYTGLVCFWPTILVVNWVAPLERRSGYLIFAAYFSIWLVITAIGISISPEATWGDSILGWLAFNFVPTLIVMLFLYRRIRAVGSMVFTFLAFGLSGLELYYQELAIISRGDGAAFTLLSRLHELGVNLDGVLMFLLVLSILLMATLGWFALQLFKWLYLHKRQSGQSLLLDPIWIMFGFFVSAMTALENPWWILAGPVAFICYKIVTWTGFALLNHKRRKIKGLELLLLRVFSLGKRSEQLYGLIARAWRYVGDIRFITGPDLATSTVEPHNFLDYISGRLRHHFIDSAETLERRIKNADVFPGLDGRYRIHDFFCYDDTWKMVLSRLAKGSDAILMDLRKFSRTNAGCAFEINELVNYVPLKRVVFVIDKTTDEVFLRECVENAWRGLSIDSPNQEECPKVYLDHYDEARPGALHQLLHALSVAATSS